MSKDELKNIDNSIISQTRNLIESEGENQARFIALEKVAISIGAQHGFADKIADLKSKLISIEGYMDKSIDFKAVMLAASGADEELFLLPPVISEINNTATVSEDNNILRITGKIYSISKPERLVLSIPTWREYLLLDRDVVTKQPHPSMLPQTDEEKAVWAAGVERGWEAGQIQASHELNDRINQLKEDYVGMLRYMRLVHEGKIDQPIIAKVHQNIIKDGESMKIDDITYRLTKRSSLQSNVENWKPLILDTRDGFRYDGE